ncbi:glycosyltransferase [Alcaligenaceae bacterium]|nr:glycosyltransferase [Alcaligenaceae bacterium]
MNGKKRILLISCSFYPQNRISVLRVGQWAKYWASQGHKVTVLTTRKYSFMGPFGLDGDLPKEVAVVEVPCRLIWLQKWLGKHTNNPYASDSNCPSIDPTSRLSRLKSKAREIRQYIGSMFDIHDLWVAPARKAGMRLLAEQRYDVIVSSYSPPATHVVASKLKAKHPELVWFADFRDLWANNHITAAKGLFKILELAKEHRTIQNRADALITVSAPLAADLQTRHPDLPVWVIENGFDPEEFPSWMEAVSADPQLENHITICYTGTIYPNRRDPTPLFTAVNDLIDAGLISPDKVSIDFYSQNERELNNIIRLTAANRHNIIKIKGFVTRQASLEAQRKSSLLLLLESSEPDAKGMLTGKIFEYLVSGIPILAVGIDPTHAAAELLERTGTGICSNDTEELKQLLLAAIKFNRFSFYDPHKELIAKYSREKQAKSIIDRLATLHQGATPC